MPKSPDAWDENYRSGDAPWDTRLPSKELAARLDQEKLSPARAVEVGCGTGTNCIALAQRGWSVTGIDWSQVAIIEAIHRAQDAKANVEFIQADVTQYRNASPPFDFVFDRGCYHAVRQEDLRGYLACVESLTRRGSRMLLLAGHPDAEPHFGIPRVTRAQIEAELSPLFAIQRLEVFHFEDAGGAVGPLGWSCLMQRKG